MQSAKILRQAALCLLLAVVVLPINSLAEVIPIAQRLDSLLEQLDPDLAFDTRGGLDFPGLQLRTQDCGAYPYNKIDAQAERHLARDLHAALQQGIQCMIGKGPMGQLHRYHEYQAHRLLQILESPRRKTFRCVADRMFANAVATTEKAPSPDDALHELLRETPHPAVVIDTFRVGGLLSTRHPPETYRNFFKLDEEQIREHLTGSPLRAGDSHRYRDLPALLFHEMVHWLGFEHSALYPDMAHLYESCCFGGSDYIDDPQQNAAFQARACNTLRDDELWSNAYSKYRQMRLWRFKGYDRLKSEMRGAY